MATPREEGIVSSVYALKVGAQRMIDAAGDTIDVLTAGYTAAQEADQLRIDLTAGDYHPLVGAVAGYFDSSDPFSARVEALATVEAHYLGYNPLDVADAGPPVESKEQTKEYGSPSDQLSLLGADVTSSAKQLGKGAADSGKSAIAWLLDSLLANLKYAVVVALIAAYFYWRKGK